MLTRAEANLRARGVTLWLVALNPGVRQMLGRSPLGDMLGSERVFPNLFTAVKAYGQLSQSGVAGTRPQGTVEKILGAEQ